MACKKSYSECKHRLLFINIIRSVEKSGNFSLSDEWQPKFPKDFASWGSVGALISSLLKEPVCTLSFICVVGFVLGG